STLREIIEAGYLYVDKTKIALDIIESGKYYFLSRPRRFGKSLFLDTLRTIFDGDKEVFEGFEQRVFEILRMNQLELDIDCDNTLSIGGCLEDLIYQSYKKYNKRVVILIDEYDKPILDNIEDLKNFYSVIKGSDEYIKLVFITGVSKFSKISLFSGLNNLDDITLTPKYATICGYTQNDVETTFATHLKGQDFKKIAQWYNGTMV
ncbi:MAG: AAA family ATPase, partial [Sulfurovum sp.]|nr:AAA family ATPase [Sulfurovum sp.]